MGSPTGRAGFSYEGVDHTLIFDMEAIAFFEMKAGVSILEALQRLEAARLGGSMPMLSHLAFLMQAGLHKNHPEISAEAAVKMAIDAEVQKSLGVAVASAMPDADADAEGNVASPAKRAKASTGTKRSKAR
ncbi:hypothetical protein [Novosphingobium album (ex Liu et al. 2023)]|uniref:Gene transfer agent family protein n=1 Tax=Novosphingobium album (ex Liu et al. 2023) TaxID=3031130 RepID=A0ABT5WQ49_9SPHN|nr:hypothetical protein [Novosphingobium album (ex Liu et al. 2023)]MDE8651881.1 hypothetical protein [Novosphingobium album (ex Liu et al. 2023)]